MREPCAGVRAERRAGLDDGEDRQPEHVEIGEVHDLAVEIGAPVAVDDAEQEEAGEEEEIRHAERPREGDHVMHEALTAGGLTHAERRMHHDDENDADALGVVEPYDAVVAIGRRDGWRGPVLGTEAGADALPRLDLGHALVKRRTLGHGSLFAGQPYRYRGVSPARARPTREPAQTGRPAPRSPCLRGHGE